MSESAVWSLVGPPRLPSSAGQTGRHRVGSFPAKPQRRPPLVLPRAFLHYKRLNLAGSLLASESPVIPLPPPAGSRKKKPSASRDQMAKVVVTCCRLFINNK